MTVAEYVVDSLIRKGVTDSFGLPGGVILELLYAMDRRKEELTPHLTYHEQGAAFAAIGYAQASGKLGVAYATRGPGLTNMMTGIADAYYDSVPALFITAHDSPGKKPGMRIQNNQEMDTAELVKSVTKYAARVDSPEAVAPTFEKACRIAMEGRKGPILLDFYSPLFRKETDPPPEIPNADGGNVSQYREMTRRAVSRLAAAKRPVLLIGNGVRQSGADRLVRVLAERSGIPVLSSRAAGDIMPDSPVYFGFIGSHALRAANFILSKADVALALGNRLAFPVNSQSFRPIVEKTAILRVDADEAEFLREVPGSVNFKADLQGFLPVLLEESVGLRGSDDWLSVCRKLRRNLQSWDRDAVSDSLASMLSQGSARTFICDVGNHSFQVTNAYFYSEATGRILYSNSFGSLGCALPKAVGAYYATRQPVLCFTGDQGFQLNAQELQIISGERLPITVVVINNQASAMIRDRESKAYGGHFVHTTPESGYAPPPLKALSEAYGLRYRRVSPGETIRPPDDGRLLVDFRIDASSPLVPYLPNGNACQDMRPSLPPDLYRELDEL